MAGRRKNRGPSADDMEKKAKTSGESANITFIDWSGISKERYKPETEQRVKFDIVPFEIKGKDHPIVVKKKGEIGDLDAYLTVFVHRNIGEANADILCPKRNFGKPCPLCNEWKKHWDEDEKEAAKPFSAKERVLVNIRPYVDGLPGDDVEVLDISHHLFTAELLKEARREGEMNFAHMDEGKLISAIPEPKTYGKAAYVEFESFRFEEREEPVTDDLVDSAVSFEQHLIQLPFEEIEAIMYGQDPDSSSEENAKEESGLDLNNVEDPLDVPAGNSTSLDADLKEEEKKEKEEAEKSARRTARIAARKAKEEKAKAKETIPKVPKCPVEAGTFGVTVDEYPACDSCPHWDACDAKNRE